MNLNHIFPLTTLVCRGQPKSLAVVIGIYLAVSAIVKIADWLVGWLPLVGAILWALFWLVGIYCAAGIIVAVLSYFGSGD